MRWFEWPRRAENDVDELFKRVERLIAVVSRIETEWADTKDQVRRSYQRLEKAGQNAAPHLPPPTPTPEQVQAAAANLDPYSRKVFQVRSHTNADASGLDESAG